MKAFFTILKKELKAVTKESTILIAILIQLFIASFSSALLVGLMAVYDPEAKELSAQIQLRVGVLGNMNSPLISFMEDYHARITPFATPEDAENAFQAGEIQAVIVLPEVVPEDEQPVVNVRLFMPESEIQTTMILMVLREPLKQYENYLRAKNGIHIRYTDLEGVSSTTHEFRYAVIIPLLMFFPAFVTGSLVVDSISEEISNRTLETLWSAPLSLNTIFGAKIANALVLSVAQCSLWIALLRFNGIHIQNMWLVLTLATVSAALIAVGAAFIAVYFKDRERSQFTYSLFILLSTSLSYFFDASPIALITRLSTGDYYAGFVDVAAYGLLLLAVLAVFLSSSKKLIAVPS
ncbi:MAG: ABC transporter permease [Chloroflexi bacterium]|nr:ABC transporter permease [Chloroflexota bacterium]